MQKSPQLTLAYGCRLLDWLDVTMHIPSISHASWNMLYQYMGWREGRKKTLFQGG